MFKEVLLFYLIGHISILALIAGFFSTEILLVLSALAGAGEIPIWVVFVFGLLGEIVHDIVFFYLAKTRFIFWVKKKLKILKGTNKVEELIEKTAYGGYFIPILMAKFVYGVRDALILYVGHKEKDFGKYFAACFPASVISLAVLTGLGWLGGKGIIALSGWYGGLEKVVGLIIISAIIVYVAYQIVGKIAYRMYINSMKNITKGIKKIDKNISGIVKATGIMSVKNKK